MRQIWIIALNHLRSALNTRIVVIMTFVVPIIMIIFLGSALNFSRTSGQIIDVMRSPTDDLASQYVALLRAEGHKQLQGQDRFVVCDLSSGVEQPQACKLSDLKPGEDPSAYSNRRVENGLVLASVRLPETFGADLRAGNKVVIGLNTKSSLSTMQAALQELDAVNARLGGTALAGRIATSKAQGDSDFFNKMYSAADSVWAKDPVNIAEVSSTTTGTGVGSGFEQTAPGIGAMFVMISALTLGEMLLQERKQGTMQRLMVMPVSRAQILAGKLLGQYLLGVLTFAIMIAVGTMLKVRWGDWSGVIVTVLAYVLAVTAMGLALATLVRTNGQAAGIRMLVSLSLAPLGGAWWTIALVPAWMQILGRISPIYWSQDAFTRLIFYGARLSEILPSIGVLLLFAAVFFLFGISRYHYE